MHAVLVYQGAGQFGHYVCFIRQADGAFLCFDDETVTEHQDAASVKAAIVERGSDLREHEVAAPIPQDSLPASERVVVYRRRGAKAGEPLELPGPEAPAPAAESGAGGESEEGIAKRRRTQ